MNIQSRWQAFGIHVSISMVIGVAVLIFFNLAYPGELKNMMSAWHIMGLIVFCDVVLGPLLTLLVFNTKKPRVELKRDLWIIAALQLLAICYGIHQLAQARPIFMVYAVDRFEIVQAGELDASDLMKSKNVAFHQKSWMGPKWVYFKTPEDHATRQDLLFKGVMGKDLQYFPEYYESLPKNFFQLNQKGVRENGEEVDFHFQNDFGTMRVDPVSFRINGHVKN